MSKLFEHVEPTAQESKVWGSYDSYKSFVHALVERMEAEDLAVVASTTPEDMAQIFDDTHDLLLVGGWIQKKASDAAGRHCFVGAISEVTRDRRRSALAGVAQRIATNYLQKRHADGVVAWNDHPARTIDDVLDLLRNLSKGLRNGDIEIDVPGATHDALRRARAISILESISKEQS